MGPRGITLYELMSQYLALHTQALQVDLSKGQTPGLGDLAVTWGYHSAPPTKIQSHPKFKDVMRLPDLRLKGRDTGVLGYVPPTGSLG